MTHTPHPQLRHLDFIHLEEWRFGKGISEWRELSSSSTSKPQQSGDGKDAPHVSSPSTGKRIPKQKSRYLRTAPLSCTILRHISLILLKLPSLGKETPAREQATSILKDSLQRHSLPSLYPHASPPTCRQGWAAATDPRPPKPASWINRDYFAPFFSLIVGGRNLRWTVEISSRYCWRIMRRVVISSNSSPEVFTLKWNRQTLWGPIPGF